jgi:hypothetical protein
MAVAANLPSETEEAFEPPSTDDQAIQKSKEVSWSATPKEIDQETIEKRKMPIQYQIAAHLSVKTVLHQDPEVGSKHQTVLASWKAIFGPAQTPRATSDPPAAPPATEKQPRRSRQQRLPEIENDFDKPHGAWMQQKEQG